MIESKLPHVGTTIFTRMSSLANECGALNLSQGFPDFGAPKPLLDALVRRVSAGHNQYAPMAGVTELREQIAAQLIHIGVLHATRIPKSRLCLARPKVFFAP